MEFETKNHQMFNTHILQSTCHRTLCAVQVLKIRRPNYFDFSVKTMVTMKLFQQQNGTTCFIIVLKVSFMWKYANDSIKEMKWWIITILFYFTFPFIKYKHCNIVTILSLRGCLILSTCTALMAGGLVILRILILCFYLCIGPLLKIFRCYTQLDTLLCVRKLLWQWLSGLRKSASGLHAVYTHTRLSKF